MAPSPSSRPTQRDIAELAGVSITTVSHVVNETRSVAPETREAVLDAVQTTGYTGDAIARSLVTGGTRSLGVVITPQSDPYFATLLQAIEHAATEKGYAVLLADTHDNPDTELAKVRSLRSRRIDGLLLMPSPGDSAVLSELVSPRMPLVLLDRLSNRTDVDQVGVENIQATSTLTEHLATLGHRRIGLISGTEGIPTSDERTLGYRLGLGRAGLPWDPELIAAGQSDREQAVRAFTRLLDMPDPPSGVVVGSDVMMSGVLRGAWERGIRVGRDIAVVGYDDPEWADLVDPALTTMAQPVAEIGRRAVRALLTRITEPDGTPETIRIAPSYRHRHSCGC